MGVSSPKEVGKKSTSSSEEVRMTVNNLRNLSENKHSGYLLKCILANDEQQTLIYIIML